MKNIFLTIRLLPIILLFLLSQASYSVAPENAAAWDKPIPKNFKQATSIPGSCGTVIYPEMAERFNLEGTAMVELDIGVSGDVLHVRLATSSGAEILDLATIAYMSQCKFNPATQDGKSVASQKKMKQTWHLEDEQKNSNLNEKDAHGFGSQFSQFSTAESINFPTALQNMCENFVRQISEDHELTNLTKNLSKTRICDCVEKQFKKDKYLKALYSEDKKLLPDQFDEEKLKLYFAGRLITGFFSCTSPEFIKETDKIDPTKK